jgi:hypothetical protein
MRRTVGVFAGAMLGLLLWATPAEAQVEVSPSFKGTIGCGLIGAELPLMVESLLRIQNGWILGGSAVAGAVGGGIFGWLVVEPDSAELSMGALVVGMALIIPTIGLVVNATSYRRGDDEASFVDGNAVEETTGDASAGDEGASGGFQVGGSTTESTPAPAPTPPPQSSLLRLDAGAVALAVPVVGIVPDPAAPVFAVSIASGTF